MTEQKDQKEKKKLSLSRLGRLELNKTVGAGQVRQNFSHGRSKSVTVEVRRKRTFTQTADGTVTEVIAEDEKPLEELGNDVISEAAADAGAAAAGCFARAVVRRERAGAGSCRVG